MTMCFISLALPLLSFLFRLIILSVAEQEFLQFQYSNCYYERGNYTNESAYHTNVDALLRNFASDTKLDYGFYTSSQGQKSLTESTHLDCPKEMWSQVLARRCLRSATILLPKKCPNQKQVFGYNNGCMPRYPDHSIFGFYLRPNRFAGISSKVYAKDVNYFNETANGLLQNLTRTAAAGNSHRKFAASIAQGLYRTPIYGLVQCTPDLSEQDCRNCLEDTIVLLNYLYKNQTGATLYNWNCIVR